MPAPPTNTPLILSAGLPAPGDPALVVGGATFVSPDGALSNMIAVMFDFTGALVPAFGVGGVAVAPSFITGSEDIAQGIGVQSTGKLVLVGLVIDASDTGNVFWGLCRLNADGSFDTSFGTGGHVITTLGPASPSSNGDAASAVIVQGDDKILVAGFTNQAAGLLAALVRYNPDGSLDSGFGTGGIVTEKVGTNNNNTYDAIALQGDGKVVVVGDTQGVSGLSNFLVVRYTAAGVLDGTWGTGGVATASFSGPVPGAVASAVAIQGDGKVVVVGYTVKGVSNTNVAVARFDTAGVLDGTFGTGGLFDTSFVAAAADQDQGLGVAIQGDGKIVVTGQHQSNVTGFYQMGALRLTALGALDGTYGTGGRVLTSFPSNDAISQAIFLQADGKTVLVGSNNQQTTETVALARLDTVGVLDGTFGSGGLDDSGVQSAGTSVILSVVPTPAVTSVLSGTVTDSGTSLGLVGWTVTLGGDLSDSTVTDGSGNYSFSESVVNGQSYTVTITVTPQGGYTAASANPAIVNFTGGDDATQNFLFTPAPAPVTSAGHIGPFGADKRPWAYYLANMEAARQRQAYSRRRAGVMGILGAVPPHPAAGLIAARQGALSNGALAVLLGEL